MYVTTARQLKRIDSVKRSPVYANFTESLNGVNSIRAYGQTDRFVENADSLLDNNQKVWFTVFTSNRLVEQPTLATMNHMLRVERLQTDIGQVYKIFIRA